MLKDKTLLITGGTGSFGNAVIKRFLNTNIKEIRIFSRDEKKQDDMRIAYQNDKLKYSMKSPGRPSPALSRHSIIAPLKFLDLSWRNFL